MKTKELIKRDPGFQYVVDHIEPMSSAGRRVLLDAPFLTSAEALEAEWERLQLATHVVMDHPTPPHAYTDLRHCFMQLHDLQGTLDSLANHVVLNEVELFEIKNLAHLAGKSAAALSQLQLSSALPLPPLDNVFSMLDPDRTGVVNFYIYDSYDERLAPLRSQLRALQEHDGDPKQISDLLSEQADIQQQVCTRLSAMLQPLAPSLKVTLEQLAYADMLFARAELVKQWQLSRPLIGNRMAFTQLVNPRLRDRNLALGLRYQPVDIALSQGVTLITGANMAGKTVLLKSVGIATQMAQTGMFVPAQQAEIVLVDDVVSSIGDEQNEMNGLSSYASEMLKISQIVARTRTARLLVLIDEPARTTNPVEGKAIVQALATLLQQSSSFGLVTTHYGQLNVDCRRLRVHGFVEDLVDQPLRPDNISLFIDYSLDEDTSDDVPHEALRIAEILACDATLLKEARGFLES